MFEAAGISLLGGFEQPIRAKTWSDRVHSRINPESLEASPYSLVVAALYTHPFFRGTANDALRRQLQEAQKFIESHPHWALARNCQEARTLLEKNQRVLLLSLEGASDALDPQTPLDAWLAEFPIAILTPLHFVDDWIGGAALVPGIRAIINPRGWMSSWRSPRGLAGELLNPNGLSTAGKTFIEKMIDRKIWIDLAHSSQASLRDIQSLLQKHHQVPLFTHTMLREYYPGERGITAEQLDYLKHHQGIVGLIPSEDELGNTRRKNPGCHSGLSAYLDQLRVTSSRLTARSISVGSDLNAPLNFLGPECPDQAPGAAGVEPFVHYGHLMRLHQAIGERQIPLLTAREFLNRCPSR
jgi:microsomal dipeptidase-like Zn-dependent dipeptidase